MMDKFPVDYSHLDNSLNPKKVYRLADVKDRIRKVAFDVVRFVDSENIDGLWQIQECDDGEYIVATYDGEDVQTEKTSSDWTVMSDKTGENLSVFYKDIPVKKVATASCGIPKEEAYLVCTYLPQKLASNTTLRSGLLNELSADEKAELLSKYPELNDDLS